MTWMSTTIFRTKSEYVITKHVGWEHYCTQLFNVVKKPSYLTQLNPVISVVIFNWVMKIYNSV